MCTHFPYNVNSRRVGASGSPSHEVGADLQTCFFVQLSSSSSWYYIYWFQNHKPDRNWTIGMQQFLEQDVQLFPM